MTEAEMEFEARAQDRAMGLGFFDQDPPRAVKADTRGLPPARARLARLLAWESETQTEIAELQHRRSELAAAVAAPARTREQISQIERADRARLRTSSGPVDATLTRTAERDSLVNRLRTEDYAAQQAGKILQQVDLDIKSRRIGLRFLDGRKQKFVDDATVESSLGLAEAYQAKIAEIQEILLQLFGLAHATGTTQSLVRSTWPSSKRPDGSREIPLPHFDFGGDATETKISATKNAIESAAAPWRAVGAEWLLDPHKDPVSVYNAAKKR